MRVALDVTPITTGTTGVARYSRELLAGLARAGVDVAPFSLGRGPHPAPAGTRQLRVPLRVAQQLWQVTRLPRAEHLVGRIDLSHCLDLTPLPTRRPLVMTAHDLAAVESPELHSPRQVAQQVEQLVRFRSANLVCAVSETTAAALRRHGVSDSKIVVTPNGLSVLPGPAANPVGGRYFLAVGELTPRKNLPMLIAAFRAAALPDDIRLVLVGPDGHAPEATRGLLGGRVIALGRVADDVLAALYRDALALCFPSLAEGFGLPMLEAMSFGTSVLASELPISREVAGEGALYAAAGDPRAWTGALEAVVNDDALRRRLGQAGRARSRDATWDRTVDATLAGYQRVLRCE